MKAYPTKLQVASEGQLQIEWNDGQRREYTVRDLRDNCPCASCREKAGQPAESPAMLPVLLPDEAGPLKITGMKPVGHYAYAITFSDGHDLGMYTLRDLRAMGREGWSSAGLDHNSGKC